MNSSYTSLEVDWKILSSQNREVKDLPGVITSITNTTGKYGAARIAISEHGGLRLLIPLGGAQKAEIISETNNVLSRNISRLTVSGEEINFLDIVCNDSNLNNVFTDLCREILSRLPDADDIPVMVEEVIEEFRKLLRSTSSKMTKMQVVGLLGELLFLKELTNINKACLNTWLGWDATALDFMGKFNGVEVKTSINDGRKIHISSIDQLSIPPGYSLYLMHYVIREVTENGFSFSSIYNDILKNNVDKNLLDSNLEKLGIEKPTDDAILLKQYALLSKCMYRVEPGFPRLVREMLLEGDMPRGVTDCSYQIELAAAKKYKLSDDDSQYVIKNMTS